MTTVDELIELLVEAKKGGAETVQIRIIDSQGSVVTETIHQIGEVQPHPRNQTVLEIYND